MARFLNRFYYHISDNDIEEKIIPLDQYNEWLENRSMNFKTVPLGSIMFDIEYEYRSQGKDDFAIISDFLEIMSKNPPEAFAENQLHYWFSQYGLTYTPSSRKLVDTEEGSIFGTHLTKIVKIETLYDIDGGYFNKSYYTPFREGKKHGLASMHLLSYISLQLLIKNNYSIYKCSNCGRYFASQRNDSSIKYCDNISPVQPRGVSGRTCKEYGKYINSKKKQDADICRTLHKRIANRLQKRYERSEFKSDDWEKNRQAEETFRKESREKRKQLEKGLITYDDYYGWLHQQDATSKEQGGRNNG